MINQECKSAFDKALEKFAVIHNNGRYWDTYELYDLWQIAYNLNSTKVNAANKLVKILNNYINPAHIVSISDDLKGCWVYLASEHYDKFYIPDLTAAQVANSINHQLSKE
jgi:hypothetical protein